VACCCEYGNEPSGFIKFGDLYIVVRQLAMYIVVRQLAMYIVVRQLAMYISDIHLAM
jgi:hypothetical protein